MEVNLRWRDQYQVEYQGRIMGDKLRGCCIVRRQDGKNNGEDVVGDEGRVNLN